MVLIAGRKVDARCLIIIMPKICQASAGKCGARGWRYWGREEEGKGGGGGGGGRTPALIVYLSKRG